MAALLGRVVLKSTNLYMIMAALLGRVLLKSTPLLCKGMGCSPNFKSPKEILKIRLPWSVFQHSLCTHNWFFWRPLFTIFLEWCCVLLDFYDLLYHSIIWLLVPLNEGTSVDIFPFTYTKYRNKVSGLVLFLHWFAVSFVRTFFQPFVENAFGAVKTIMILSNISRRLPSKFTTWMWLQHQMLWTFQPKWIA